MQDENLVNKNMYWDTELLIVKHRPSLYEFLVPKSIHDRIKTDPKAREFVKKIGKFIDAFDYCEGKKIEDIPKSKHKKLCEDLFLVPRKKMKKKPKKPRG